MGHDELCNHGNQESEHKADHPLVESEQKRGSRGQLDVRTADSHAFLSAQGDEHLHTAYNGGTEKL